jgi:hypothetical protein
LLNGAEGSVVSCLCEDGQVLLFVIYGVFADLGCVLTFVAAVWEEMERYAIRLFFRGPWLCQKSGCGAEVWHSDLFWPDLVIYFFAWLSGACGFEVRWRKTKILAAILDFWGSRGGWGWVSDGFGLGVPQDMGCGGFTLLSRSACNIYISTRLTCL